MKEYKIEIQFDYEEGHYFHYVFGKKKDATAAILSAVKEAQSHFSSCGWKSYEITHVGLISNPNTPPKYKEYDPPSPPHTAVKPKPKRTSRNASKTEPSSKRPATKRAQSTGTRTKPAVKTDTPAKRVRKTTRKPKN